MAPKITRSTRKCFLPRLHDRLPLRHSITPGAKSRGVLFFGSLMNRFVITGCIILARFVAFFAARYFLGDGGGDDLTGTWVVTAVEERGQKVPMREVPFKAVKFERGQVVWIVAMREGLGEVRGEFQTDPSKSPKHIDIDLPA